MKGFFEHPWCCGPDRGYTGRPTVLGEVGPEDAPALLVMAHSDVVPMNNDPSQWKVTGPFQPAIRDGAIYGRGCSDDKWGIACMIHILRALHDDATPLRKRLIFASTIDEENGVGNGLLLLHLAGLEPEAAFYLDGVDHVLSIGNLGGSNLYLHLPGGLTRDRLTALEGKLIAACEQVSAGRRSLFTGLFADNDMADHSVFARLHENGPLVLHFYTLPGEDGDAFGRQLESVAREALGGEVDEIGFSYRTPWFEPTVMDADHPFVQGLAASFRAVYGRDALVSTVSKQDSFIMRKVGIPTVGFGPGAFHGPGAAHQPDERLRIDDLHAALRFSHQAVCDWLAV